MHVNGREFGRLPAKPDADTPHSRPMHVTGSLSQEGASGDENSSLSDLAPLHNAWKVDAALDEVAQ